MHDDLAGHGVAEAEIVGGRHPINQHRRLIASRHGLDHPAVIRDGQPGRQPVVAWPVIEAAVKPAELIREGEPLQRLVHSLA